MGTTADELVREATARAGSDNLGDDWFRTPLELFVADLGDAPLSDGGRRFMTEQAIRDLVRRIEVLDFLDRHPEIDEVQLPPIVYVTGQVRSGSTLLHNLLACHELGRPILRWELMQPLPPPEAATYATDPRIASTQAAIDKRRGTMLEQMHWVNADEPEECKWGFIDFVSILGGSAGAVMRRWSAFVDEADMTPVFANYRRVLKLLLWKNPPPDGGFLVLKAPQVATAIGEFAEVFPEARFVLTARDPYRVIVSGCTMLDDILSALVDRERFGSEQLAPIATESVERSVAAVLAYVESADTPPLVLPYPSVVGHPVSTTIAAYAELGLPADDGLGARIEGFLSRQREGLRAAPPARLPDWGLDHDEVLSRPVLAEFCARFGVEPERRRLTGAT